ncbi:MAG: hypothetical protein AAB561_00470 [Patescibacteria group bacterium]
MTTSKRASYKARTMLRVTDESLHQAEVRFPDGAIVQVWLVGREIHLTGGDSISLEEMEILTEKVHKTFPENKQLGLF